MPLTKAICIHCWREDTRAAVRPLTLAWSRADDQRWDDGWLWCVALLNESKIWDEAKALVKDQPPPGCPFAAEHAVSQRSIETG